MKLPKVYVQASYLCFGSNGEDCPVVKDNFEDARDVRPGMDDGLRDDRGELGQMLPDRFSAVVGVVSHGEERLIALILQGDVVLDPEFMLSTGAHEDDDIAVQGDGRDNFADCGELLPPKSEVSDEMVIRR